jgi:uncharacterized integral membrane protein
MELINAGRRFGLPLALGIVIGAFFVIFALENTTVTTINFVSWTLSLPLALLVTGALCLGAVATIIAMIPGFIKNERYIRELEEGKKAVEDELAKYSIVIPLAPPDQLNSKIPVYVRPIASQHP